MEHTPGGAVSRAATSVKNQRLTAGSAARRNSSGLVRDVELLELVATADPRVGMGVTELAGLTGRDKGVISRAMATLQTAGLVHRDPTTRAYRVGARIYALASRTVESTLTLLARPILRRVTLLTRETSHLCVLHDGNVLTLASELSPHEVRTTSWQGVTTAAWRTPSGRVLLSDWDGESLLRWYQIHGQDKVIVSQLDLAMMGPGFTVLDEPPQDRAVVRDFDSLLAEIDKIRASGFATLDEELEEGVVGASAPVRDFTGAIIAAINVSAPKARMRQRLPELGQFVARAAAELSSQLGAPPAGAAAT